MSKLEELIKEFCPNGVEYKKINEFTKLLRGKRLTKSQLVENGKYAVYHGSLVPLGYYSEANRDSGVIIVNTGGIGGVGYSDTPFWCSDGCFCLAHSPKMVDKYVYYALVGFKDYLISRTRVGGVPTIDSDTVLSIKIPLPALPVQREIVRILDSFTLYSAELTTKLTAELTTRRKQYEFYRDKLLTFDRFNIEWKEIGEIFDVRDGTHDSPKMTTEGYYLVTSKNIKNGKVNFEGCYRISERDYNLINKRSKVYINDLLFTMIGTLGEVAIIKERPDYAIKNIALIRTDNAVTSKYLYHYLQTGFVKKYIDNNKSKGSQVFLALGKLRELKIPVPPIDVQERIVKVLDNFDAICSDLGIGLPTEIEKRQKQYEYYREKLLTFDGKYATILTERAGLIRLGYLDLHQISK